MHIGSATVCIFLPHVYFRFFSSLCCLQTPIINLNRNHSRKRVRKKRRQSISVGVGRCHGQRFKLHTKITSNVANQLKLFPNEHRLIRFSDRKRICLQFFFSSSSFVLFCFVDIFFFRSFHSILMPGIAIVH